MNVAIIPARRNSKGVPGKNIKLLNNKPLIAWSIEQALEAQSVDETFVSTDCEEIMQISLNNGAKVPFLRPKSISGDKATSESAVIHFLKWAAIEQVPIDNVILMQPTSPFRYSKQIDSAMQQFLKEEADSLVTVNKSHKFFWKKNKSPIPSYDIFNRPRRQDLASTDEIYFENGSFYITKLSIYNKYKNRLGGKISMFEMSPEESIEIDSIYDFKLIEFFMNEFL